MMARLPKGYTIKQDGNGGATVVKKTWGRQDASAQIRMRKSKKIKVQRPQFGFKPK